MRAIGISAGAILICTTLLTPSLSWAEAASEGVTAFYVWLDEIPNTPGRLLRQEPLEAELILKNAESGVRVLYSSQGWEDQPVVVSGAVFIPKGAPPKGGWPVLAWSHGTVGVADVCAPSYAGRSERDINYLNKWLAEGYAIVATDYEGLGTAGMHTYLHCRSEAYGNIDAVRAAQQLGLPLAKDWLVMGQSQGGQGALCTSAYAAGRAPEQQLLGVLATAPGIYLEQRFGLGKAEDPNPFIGFSLYLAKGFEAYEPTFRSEDAFTDEAMALLTLTDEMCVRELLEAGRNADLTTGQSLKIVPFGAVPGVESAGTKMAVPLMNHVAPIYLAQGTADKVVRAVDVYNFGADLCERGTDVHLDIYADKGHSGPMNAGFDAFKRWVADRFAGRPAANNCDVIQSLAD